MSEQGPGVGQQLMAEKYRLGDLQTGAAEA